MKKIFLFVLLLSALAVGVSSCKAWRTITTTTSYVPQNDSAKVTTTISTKTTEEYVGTRRK